MKKKRVISLTIMSHSQRNISRFVIKLYFSYFIKVLYFFFLISLKSFKSIEDKPFVESTRNKFQSHITLFTKYLALYNNIMQNSFLEKTKTNKQTYKI